ncbi:PTS transporter subunit EIIC [Mycoplasmopsis cynos]|uniref:PTS transporter subunit EIIC n=1 Tax=Mycoplasmopsis cynos TaxID=171284 RepID=UPI002AFF1925|nr:PTS transporter subunit EIIC [Mycoplasmopsis cynos]WQQ17127.1 PTS transporter subunit EIIC [Mycoplasmopsis cynos]
MMQSTTLQPQKTFIQRTLSTISKIGSTLMFPIAVLPVAAILLRIGAELPDATVFSKIVQTIIIKPGGVVFDNLHLIFAVGIAFGFTKDKRGEAAFAGLIAGLIITTLVPLLVKEFYGSINLGKEVPIYNDKKVITGKILGFEAIFGNKFDAILGSNVLSAIVTGAIIAFVYNRANNVELPKALGFFSGRRLIPALAIITTTLFGILWAIIFPWIAWIIYFISKHLSDNTKVGEGTNISNRFIRASIMGVYGFINRLLIPFGLHHIPNNLFWFQLGEWAKEGGEAGEKVNGDIFIFLNGVAKNNPGGIFQAGFFPVMMFGLPALVGAFIWTAENKVQKIRVLGLFGSAAVISFLSGITEPIEFAFLYVSPLLYFIHAILTGIFAFITGAFGIQLGFGFSAGLLDFITSIPKSLRIINESNFEGLSRIFANPGWIIPIGLLTATTYLFVGKFVIEKLNLDTPGRGKGVILETETTETPKSIGHLGFSEKARSIVKNLGGWDNIVEYNNCSTRLRYLVKDSSLINEDGIKKAGAFGITKVTDTSIQIIIGVEAEKINNEIVSNVGNELE